jgi:hypothetical protein
MPPKSRRGHPSRKPPVRNMRWFRLSQSSLARPVATRPGLQRRSRLAQVHNCTGRHALIAELRPTADAFRACHLVGQDQLVPVSRILASQWNDFPSVSQFVEIISPSLHHVDALRPEFRCVHVSASNIVGFLMCRLTLDGIAIPAIHFIQPRGRHSFEAVSGHLSLAIPEPTQRRIQRIFGHRLGSATHG